MYFRNIFLFLTVVVILGFILYSVTFFEITKVFSINKNTDNKQTNPPNLLLINSKLVEFNNNGDRNYCLETTKMQQYSNSSVIYLETIKFYDYDEHKLSVTTEISSNHGKLYLDKKLLVLNENIELVNINNSHFSGLKIFTNSLTVNYNSKLAYTDDEINIIYDASEITAKGINFNYLTGHLAFKHRVNTTYVPTGN